MTGAPTCPGFKTQPHDARFIYADSGYCNGCTTLRDSESERAEMGAAAGMDDDERERRTRA